jgi:stress response protein YsnF
MSDIGITSRRGLEPGVAAPGDEARRVACLFATRAEAESAVADLVAAGFDRSEIDIIDQSGETATATREESGGLWESIKRMFTGDDSAGYYEGVRRGQTLVSAPARTSAAASQAVEILERHDPIDRHVQEAAWRESGWTGAVPGPAGMAEDATDASLYPLGTPGVGTTFQGTASGPAASTAAAPARAGEEEVIPVVEEQVSVGKREVGGGRVRVHTRVIETPVEEEVRLREERVNVERRPADRPVEPGDEAFRERTVEVAERREEPVVAKSARVKEEVAVRKDRTERTERVTERARRTDVQVEDERRDRV